MAAAYVGGMPAAVSFRARPLVLVYGTSIDMGYNATDRSTQGWVAKLQEFDFDTTSDAADGRTLLGDLTSSGAVDTRVATWAASSPDIVWLAIGTNDCFGGLSLATFTTRYGQLLDAAALAMPDATIVAQTPLVRSGEDGATPEPLSAFRTAITDLCASRGAVVLVVGTALVAIGNLDDGTHPDTGGHALLAARVKSLLDAYR